MLYTIPLGLKTSQTASISPAKMKFTAKKAANSFMNTVIFFGAKAIRTKSTDIQKFIKTDSTFGILGKKITREYAPPVNAPAASRILFGFSLTISEAADNKK